MHKQVMVSVAISCYNFENYIYQCLRSFAEQQTNFAIEIIVVDDNSPDNSVAKIKQAQADYPGLITLIEHDTNRGSNQTKVSACSACIGRYIAFVDGDDFAYANKLQTQFDYLESNPDCVLCYHDMLLVDENNQSLGKTFADGFYNQQYISDKSDISDLLFYGTFLVASSQMFRREVFKADLLPAQVQIVQDYFYHIHSASLGKFGRVSGVLGAYRQHSLSYTGQTSQSTQRRLTCLKDLLLACDYAQRLGVDINTVNKGRCHFYFAAAIYFLKQQNFNLFKQCIEDSMQWSIYYDQRHQKLYQYRQQPQKALSYFLNLT